MLPARSIMIGSVIPVRTRPGATVFTRMSGATSRASCRENAVIAPLAAPYGTLLAWATSAATDATLTMDPAPCARITGTTSRQTRNVPPAWTVIIRCHCCNDQSPIGANSACPAALNRQSIVPSCSRAALHRALTARLVRHVELERDRRRRAPPLSPGRGPCPGRRRRLGRPQP